jgi:hypothetical protein
MRRTSYTMSPKFNAAHQRQNNLALVIHFHESAGLVVALDGNDGAAFDGQKSNRTYRPFENGEKGFPDVVLHDRRNYKAFGRGVQSWQALTPSVPLGCTENACPSAHSYLFSDRRPAGRVEILLYISNRLTAPAFGLSRYGERHFEPACLDLWNTTPIFAATAMSSNQPGQCQRVCSFQAQEPMR